MVKKINVILLDLGRTLVDYSTPPHMLITKTLQKYGYVLNPLDVKKALEDSEHAFTPLKRKIRKIFKGEPYRYVHLPKEFWIEYNKYLLKKLGIEFRVEIVEDLFNTFYSVDNVMIYDDVVPTLKELKKTYKLGLVSNNTEFAKLILRFFGLEKYFDVVVISYEVGVEKPDARIFKIALKRLGSRPEEAVHVGDDPLMDVKGAKNAGILPILIDRKGVYKGKVETLIIETLNELPLLLRNIQRA